MAELLREYQAVSVHDGSELLSLAGEEAAGEVQWLWPEPWLQQTYDEVSRVYDVSASVALGPELVGKISRISTVPGVAVQERVDESARIVGGLPTSVEPVLDIAASTLGAFSPDGRYWAAIDPAADELGRISGHNNLVRVVEVADNGAERLVADLGLPGVGIDGVRWIDNTTLAVVFAVLGETSVAIISRHGGEWRFEARALRDVDVLTRLFVAGNDPCTTPSRPSVSQPGCARPWR